MELDQFLFFRVPCDRPLIASFFGIAIMPNNNEREQLLHHTQYDVWGIPIVIFTHSKGDDRLNRTYYDVYSNSGVTNRQTERHQDKCDSNSSAFTLRIVTNSSTIQLMKSALCLIGQIKKTHFLKRNVNLIAKIESFLFQPYALLFSACRRRRHVYKHTFTKYNFSKGNLTGSGCYLRHAETASACV